MTSQTEMAELAGQQLAADAPAKGESTYVVQVEQEVEVEVPPLSGMATAGDAPKQVAKFEKRAAWVDVATVSVPARTKRKTIIARALTEAGIKPDPGQPAPRVRVLDEESAFVHEPGAVQPPAEWVVS